MLIGRRSFLYALGLTTGAHILPGCAQRTTLASEAQPSSDGPGADAEPAPDPSVTGSVEIMNWWGQEAAGMAAVMATFSTRFPNVNAINTAMNGALEFISAMAQRGAAGNPPDLLQTLGGKQMIHGSITADGKDPSTGYAEAMTDIYQEDNLTAAFPKDILDLMSFGGEYYGVPLSLARANSMYYNRKVLTANGLTAPKTWDDFFAAAEVLKSKKVIPIIFGNSNGDDSALQLFMAVLLGQLGAVPFRRFLEGKGDPLDPGIGRAVGIYARVLRESNLNADLVLSMTDGDATAAAALNSNQMYWKDVLGAIAEGKGAMMVTGDWADGFLRTTTAQAGVDYDVAAAPGSNGAFLANLDSFYMLKGAPNADNARLLFRFLASRVGQDTFNPLKGSISARMDSNLAKYDVTSQSVAKDYAAAAAAGNVVAHYVMTLPWEVYSKLGGVISDLARDSLAGKSDAAFTDAVQTFFKDRYPTLQAY